MKRQDTERGRCSISKDLYSGHIRTLIHWHESTTGVHVWQNLYSIVKWNKLKIKIKKKKNPYNSLSLFQSPILQRQTTQLAVHTQSKGWPGNGCVKVWMEYLWSGTEEEVWGGWGKLWLWTGASLSIEYWQEKPQICIFNKFPGDALSQSSIVY